EHLWDDVVLVVVALEVKKAIAPHQPDGRVLSKCRAQPVIPDRVDLQRQRGAPLARPGPGNTGQTGQRFQLAVVEFLDRACRGAGRAA
ncbi:MAG: hypothetical protein H6Q02_420, partial [Acidobacteria bacterium]|nr:hypothetical protein [Acidobacteriota bacterium]